MSCNHITRVKEWGFSPEHNLVPTLYDCTLCGEESRLPFPEQLETPIDHSNCDKEPCFGCKAKGLQLNTGDASSQKAMSNKKWDGELNAYRAAKAQGIQPEGTSMAAVQRAVNASQAMGKAYDADTMTSARYINKKSAATLNEAGAI
jgi:hypothetical protein